MLWAQEIDEPNCPKDEHVVETGGLRFGEVSSGKEMQHRREVKPNRILAIEHEHRRRANLS